MVIPENLLYTKEHEWVKIEDDFATIGVTDYAQSSLGDITFVQLPALKAEFNKSDVLATVESVKAASDIYAPVSGRVEKVNDAIADKPELVNKSPYDDGWFAIVHIKNINEKDSLLQPAEYQKYLDEFTK